MKRSLGLFTRWALTIVSLFNLAGCGGGDDGGSELEQTAEQEYRSTDVETDEEREQSEEEFQANLDARVRDNRLGDISQALEAIKKPDLLPVEARRAISHFANTTNEAYAHKITISEEDLPLDKLTEVLLLALEYRLPSNRTQLRMNELYKLANNNPKYVSFVGSRVNSENGEVFFSQCAKSEHIAQYILINHPDQYQHQFEAHPESPIMEAAVRNLEKKAGKLEWPQLERMLQAEHPKMQYAAAKYASRMSPPPEKSIPFLNEFFQKLKQDHNRSETLLPISRALEKAIAGKYKKVLEGENLDPGYRELITAMNGLFDDKISRQRENSLQVYLSGDPEIDPAWPSVVAELDYLAAESMGRNKWIVDAYAKLGGENKIDRISIFAANNAGIGQEELLASAVFEGLKEDFKTGAAMFEKLRKTTSQGHTVSDQQLIKQLGILWDKEPEGFTRSQFRKMALASGEKNLMYHANKMIDDRFPPPVTRTWTSSAGKSFEGKFLSADKTEVTIERENDKKTFVVPIEQLSEADKTYIKEQLREHPIPGSS